MYSQILPALPHREHSRFPGIAVPDMAAAGIAVPGIAVPGIVIAGHGGGETRAALEAFVAREFFQHYGARLETFMPWLLGLSVDGQLAGVSGMRPAAGNPLFIEQYLDEPVEMALQACTGKAVARNTILEIGNLAGHHIGVNRALFPVLTELTYMRGYSWVVCNATRTVQNSLRRLGIPVVAIQRAEPERLGAARFIWGSYYATESTVIAMSSADAHQVLLSKQQGLAKACATGLINHYQCLPAA